jgi:hypothetical protein
MQFYFLPTHSVFAEGIPIAILDFELHDLTLIPNTPDEVKRTASIKPLLQEILVARNGYEVIEIDRKIQEKANTGFGYLFEHHDVAAQLGRDSGAEWIVVGRVHKASFLFVYFMVHVVDAKTGRLVGDLIVEVKGPQKKLTVKGVENLAKQISETLKRRRETVGLTCSSSNSKPDGICNPVRSREPHLFHPQ